MLDDALGYAEESLGINQTTGDLLNEAGSLYVIARIYRKLGRPSEAIRPFLIALVNMAHSSSSKPKTGPSGFFESRNAMPLRLAVAVSGTTGLAFDDEVVAYLLGTGEAQPRSSVMRSSSPERVQRSLARHADVRLVWVDTRR